MTYKFASVFGYSNYRVVVYYNFSVKCRRSKLPEIHREIVKYIAVIFNMNSKKLTVSIFPNKYFHSVSIGDCFFVSDEQMELFPSKKALEKSMQDNAHILMLCSDQEKIGLLRFRTDPEHFYFHIPGSVKLKQKK